MMDRCEARGNGRCVGSAAWRAVAYSGRLSGGRSLGGGAGEAEP